MALPLIPIWLAGILGASIPAILGRIMVAIGIGFLTVSGMDVLVGWIETQARSSMGQLPNDVIAYAGLMKLDIAMSIMLSGMVVKVGIGATKKLVGIT